MDAERRARFVSYFTGPPLHGDRTKLMQRTGYTKGRVAQFFDPDQPFGERAARNLAERLGLSEDAFERTAADAWTPEQHSPEGVIVPTVAHHLSHLNASNVIFRMTWEGLVQSVPDSLFALRLRDDALSPTHVRGSDLVWDRRRKPQPGKPALIVDEHGSHHARFFAATTNPGRWQATSQAPGYPSYDQDTATIVAVYRGMLDDD